MSIQPVTTVPIRSSAALHALDAIFGPRVIAVIGATERPDSVGRTVLENLQRDQRERRIYGVNPKYTSLLALPCYPSIEAIPEQIDLAIIAIPAAGVPAAVRECVHKGVRGIIILSAGFRERGTRGLALEQEIAEAIRGTGVRIIGPNCLGVMRPSAGLNATFAHGTALPGGITFLSQSGALCTSILDWSLQEEVGFSAFVSTGSMLDINWGDLITYFGDDPHTTSIMLYLESVGNARAFVSAAREVAMSKPVIILKAGRTAAAEKAAVSHTGSLAGSEAVFEAACARCGILQVGSISELFSMAEVLAKQPRPRGPRLAIVTNAGGPGVLATDALVARGGELAPLTEKTLEQLNDLLPETWSHGNPIDILGDATPDRYAETLQRVLADETTDGLLAILTPQAMTDPTGTAEILARMRAGNTKPVLASWMGGKAVAPGIALLNAHAIPTFDHPDEAAQAFTAMWQYSDNLHSLYETPVLPPPLRDDAARGQAKQLLDRIRGSGRTVLTEYESKQVLAAFGIPTVPTALATSVEEAIDFAERSGYPVVLKLHSTSITHKTDVGGVELNLATAAEIGEAFERIRGKVSKQSGTAAFEGVTVQPMVRHWGIELLIGSSVDVQFGPIIVFGAGGALVEVWEDRALGLPPLNSTLAQRQITQTKVAKALRYVRGHGPVDLLALSTLLVRFSQLIAQERLLKEVDINPLVITDSGFVALDARIVTYPPEVAERDLSPLAIRPYPDHYVDTWRLRDGTQATIRPIRPEDEPLLRAFHQTLSEQSVYLRYFHLMSYEQRVTHERLVRRCFIDYDREMALVAEHQDAQGQPIILGIGRIVKARTLVEAEFSLLVSDRYQALGLGTELLRRLINIARAEQVAQLIGYVLQENTAMQRIALELGFILQPQGEGMLRACLNLRDTVVSRA